MTPELQKAVAALDDDTLLRRIEQCRLLRETPVYRDALKKYAKEELNRVMTQQKINLALLALEPALLAEKNKRKL